MNCMCILYTTHSCMYGKIVTMLTGMIAVMYNVILYSLSGNNYQLQKDDLNLLMNRSTWYALHCIVFQFYISLPSANLFFFWAGSCCVSILSISFSNSSSSSLFSKPKPSVFFHLFPFKSSPLSLFHGVFFLDMLSTDHCGSGRC